MEEIKTSAQVNQRRKTIAVAILAIVVIIVGISGYFIYSIKIPYLDR